MTKPGTDEARARLWHTGKDIPKIEQRHRDAAAWAMDRTPDNLTWEGATAAHVAPDRLWRMKRVAEAMARMERDALAFANEQASDQAIPAGGEPIDDEQRLYRLKDADVSIGMVDKLLRDGLYCEAEDRMIPLTISDEGSGVPGHVGAAWMLDLAPGYMVVRTPKASAQGVGEIEAIEAAARAMCDRVNGEGDFDENITQRRSGWVAQAETAIKAYLASAQGEKEVERAVGETGLGGYPDVEALANRPQPTEGQG